MKQLRLYDPPAEGTGGNGISPALSEESVGADELQRRLRAAGAILATGAIRAVLRERSSQSAESSQAQQEESERETGSDSTSPAPV